MTVVKEETYRNAAVSKIAWKIQIYSAKTRGRGEEASASTTGHLNHLSAALTQISDAAFKYWNGREAQMLQFGWLSSFDNGGGLLLKM